MTLVSFLCIAAASSVSEHLQRADVLLDSGRAADALRHAHLALAHLSTEEEREEHDVYMRVGDMYAQLGLSSVAKLFFARALEFQPDSAAAMQAHASVETSKPSSDDESNLHRLALQFFRTGQLDMGLRADVERIALGYERDAGADRALVRDALDQTALLLLTSGLGAHTISMARNLLSSDSVSLACADCQSPKRQMHGDAVLGYTAGDIQRFIDCCLHRRQVLPRLLATRNVTINRANVYGYTPLHLAAAADQSELVNALLGHGADASAQTYTSQATALHLAVSRNATAAIRALVAHPRAQASLESKAVDQQGLGKTPVELACYMGFLHAVDLIDPGHACGVEAVPISPTMDSSKMCGVDVRLQSDVSAQQFLRDYVLVGKPVMIKGLLSGSSPSLGAYFNAVRWSPLRLREAYGDARVQVGDIPYASAFGRPSTAMYISEYYEEVLEDGENRSIVFQPVRTDDPKSIGHGFEIGKGTVLDPEITALDPGKVHVSLGPRGAGSPMRFARATVEILVRGSRTWLLQSPSDAMYSALHPADATETVPWPWPKEKLYSCDQEAGDILFIPEMWGQAMINNDESFSFTIETETGSNEFSINLE